MDRKRCSISKELLPYQVLFRGIDEPKYDFRTPTPRKRVRVHSTGLKKEHKFAAPPQLSMQDDDLQTNFFKPVSEEEIAPILEVDIMPMSEEPIPAKDSPTTCIVPSPCCNVLSLTDGSSEHLPAASSQPDTLKLDMVDTYTLLLKQEKMAVFCNYSLTAIMLQDYDSDKSSLRLKRNQFVVVQRRGVMFCDKCEWAYWCYCNPSNPVKSMSSNVEMLSAELDKVAPQCNHITAVKHLVKAFDNENKLIPDDFLDDPSTQIVRVPAEAGFLGVFPIGQDSTTVCVCLPEQENEYGVVTITNHKLYCMLCHRECKHTLHIEELIQSEKCPESLEELATLLSESPPSSGSKKTSPMGISWKKTPYILSEAQQKILRNGVFSFQCTGDNEVVIPLSTTESQQCPSCGSKQVKDKVSLPLIMERSIHKGLVFRLKCSNSNCSLIVHFDGSDFAILNMGIFLVSYDVVRSYMHHFLHSGCPLYTFHNILSAMQLDCGEKNFKSCFPYHWLRASWYHFLSILDIDYPRGFMCPKCDDQPSTIICDATALAFRRQLLPAEEQVSPSTDEHELLQGCSIHERVFIDNHKCRILLKTYAATATDNDELARYLDSDVEYLVACLTEHSPVLAHLINHMGNPVPCPSTCATLFSDLSSMSPVCALLIPTPEVINLMNDLCNGLEVRKFPERWQFLQENVPVLHDLIYKLGPGNMSLPSEFHSLVIDMVHKAQLPFASTPLHPCVPVSAQSSDTHSYFPCLPILWDRHRYKSDKHKDTLSCTKLYRGHPSLLPGIFTIFCPHGICYGFQLMLSCESPNIPFTIFRTRFRTAPHYIVYDNACGLHTYCLNRDPNFFKTTKFLVDRFHWSNHRGCSRAYNIEYYPSLDHLNTEVNEQANSNLSRLKSQLSYMNESNFFDHLKLFLWYRNHTKIKSIPTSHP